MSLLTSLLSMNMHQCVSEGCISQAATIAGTIPCLSPETLLSPSLLATEGKGYCSFVVFESSSLREPPSLCSSSQITGRGFFFMTTLQFSSEKAKERNTQRQISLTKLCGGHFPSYLCVLSPLLLLSTLPISPPKPDSRRI